MVKIGIVGGTGYTGVELLRILATHPKAQIVVVTSRKEAGVAVADLYPSLRGRVDLTLTAPDEVRLNQCDLVFFATPHGVAMTQAAELLAAGVKIIDLAADFRLQDTATFERWYGMAHRCPDILKEAVYGLPELNRETIKRARVVANPGCYPTSVQLGFAPLLKEAGLVDGASLIANCASGVSGAGRKAEFELLFAEASDNFKAYGVNGHRHAPEINEQLSRIAGVSPGDASLNCVFVPHLIPIIRGIHSTLYTRLTPRGQALDLQELFEDFYRGEPFVDVMPPGATPETRSVRASNIARIAVHKPRLDIATVLVVEDNLTKGAAGQAVQCMNLMFGLPETCGLMHIPALP